VPISTESTRRTAFELESAVKNRRSIEQGPLRFAAVRDVSDIESGDFFPTLDAVTRRILKAMYDALEKAANQAEQRLRAEQRQQAADAALRAAAQNEQAVQTQERQQIQIDLAVQQQGRVEAMQAPQVAGSNARDTQETEFRVAGSAEQDALVQSGKVNFGPVSSSTDAQATVQKVKQMLVETSPAKVAQLHQFVSTSAPTPPRAPSTPATQAPVAPIPSNDASASYA